MTPQAKNTYRAAGDEKQWDRQTLGFPTRSPHAEYDAARLALGARNLPSKSKTRLPRCTRTRSRCAATRLRRRALRPAATAVHSRTLRAHKHFQTSGSDSENNFIAVCAPLINIFSRCSERAPEAHHALVRGLPRVRMDCTCFCVCASCRWRSSALFMASHS